MSEQDDEQARRERAKRLREAVQEIASDRPRRPSSPRDFTEQRAREAAAEERERVDPGGGEDDDG